RQSSRLSSLWALLSSPNGRTCVKCSGWPRGYRSLRSLIKMADWQPIETAPKDGTRILLWDTDEVVIGKWDDISMGGAEGWQIAVVNMLSGLKHYEGSSFSRM